MNGSWLLLIPLIVVIITITSLTVFIVYESKKRKKLIARLDELASKQEGMKVDDFLDLYFKLKLNSRSRNFAGCYIIHNETKDIYYVGQSAAVYIRASQHFNGIGSSGVFVDHYAGDSFTIKFIPLENSGFSSLNEMERNFIGRYRAYYEGYNRTRGNH